MNIPADGKSVTITVKPLTADEEEFLEAHERLHRFVIRRNSMIIWHDQYGSFVDAYDKQQNTQEEINYALGKEPMRCGLPVTQNVALTMKLADMGAFRTAAMWKYTENYYHPR